MPKIIITKAGRDPYDIYNTPKDFVSAVLNILPNDFTPRNILDPGSGGGVWGNMARFKYEKATIHGVDVRQTPEVQIGYDEIFNNDFRDWQTETKYDLVIGNPPYAKTEGVYDGLLAEKFIRKSLDLTTTHGFVFFLLKTDFQGGVGRGLGLFKDLPPSFVYQSIRRIPFRPELGNKVNTYNYSMWLWQKDVIPTDTRIRWFDWRGGTLKYVRNYTTI